MDQSHLDGILVSIAGNGRMFVEEEGSKQSMDKVIPHLITILSGMVNGMLEIPCTHLLSLSKQDWNRGSSQGAVVEDKACHLKDVSLILGCGGLVLRVSKGSMIDFTKGHG